MALSRELPNRRPVGSSFQWELESTFESEHTDPGGVRSRASQRRQIVVQVKVMARNPQGALAAAEMTFDRYDDPNFPATAPSGRGGSLGGLVREPDDPAKVRPPPPVVGKTYAFDQSSKRVTAAGHSVTEDEDSIVLGTFVEVAMASDSPALSALLAGKRLEIGQSIALDADAARDIGGTADVFKRGSMTLKSITLGATKLGNFDADIEHAPADASGGIER